MTIEGPRGCLELDPVAGAGRWEIGGERGVLAPPPMAPEWDRQYEVFAAAIARGSAETSTVEDGLRALEATLAAEAAARSDTSVEREAVPPGASPSPRPRRSRA